MSALEKSMGSNLKRAWDALRADGITPTAALVQQWLKANPQRTPQQEQELEIMRSRGEI